MDKSLLEQLEAYASRGVRAMHMPGHKRNAGAARYLAALGARLDITEIDGFDNLHDPSGILKDAMARAAALWKSQSAFFLVGGSTCGILAGIRAAAKPFGKVIVARNSHQAVFHALDLMELDAAYVLPEYDRPFGIFASVRPEAVELALRQNPDASLVVVTSPTYDGVVSDIAGICRAAHARGVPVLVDEAHGAHLGFSEYFPGGAVAAGADIVVESLHKTLPSLTQTAIAHIGGLIDPARFQAQLEVFETSSPSYLLMASLDGCVRLIEREGDSLFKAWAARLDAFGEAVSSLSRLRALGRGRDSLSNHPSIFAFDPGKIVLSTRGTNLTGPDLAAALRERYNTELEMAACDYALAMTGLVEPDGALDGLADALIEIDRSCAPDPDASAPAFEPGLPRPATTIARALRSDAELVPLASSSGRVSAQYAWAYPPGVPLIAPGEIVDARFLEEAGRMARSGVSLRGGSAEGGLLVVRGA